MSDNRCGFLLIELMSVIIVGLLLFGICSLWRYYMVYQYLCASQNIEILNKIRKVFNKMESDRTFVQRLHYKDGYFSAFWKLERLDLSDQENNIACVLCPHSYRSITLYASLHNAKSKTSLIVKSGIIVEER